MGDLTVVQKKEVAKGAQAMGAIAGRFAKRRSDQLVSPLSTLSFWGKILAVLAFGAAIASAGMLIFDSSHIAIDRGQMGIVARDTVNVRQGPTTNSGIVTRAHSGDRYNIVSSSGKWTKIRSSDGRMSGWIASSLINTSTAKTLVYRYEMRGYALYFIVAMMVVFFSLRMRKAPVDPRQQSAETLIMNDNS